MVSDMSIFSDLTGSVANDPTFIRAQYMASCDFELVRELVQWRERREMTQGDVAELLGISTQAVSKFERYDGDHRLSSIRRYANAIGVVVEHEVSNDELMQVSSPQEHWDEDTARPVQIRFYRPRVDVSKRASRSPFEEWIAS